MAQGLTVEPGHLDDSAELEYTFEWRRGEHARVTALLVRENFRGPLRLLKWIVWLVVALAVAIATVGIAVGEASMVFPLLPLALLVGVLTIEFARIVGWMQSWQVGRTDPNAAHPITFRFADSGLQVLMHTVDAELRWSGVPRVRETPDLFLIYYNMKRAYFLPKRAIPSPEAAAMVAGWIRRRLPETSEYIVSR